MFFFRKIIVGTHNIFIFIVFVKRKYLKNIYTYRTEIKWINFKP